jgi:hypothetical protein
MRTSKRWTNETYTKRVDHDAGSHRGSVALSGPRVCERCGSVYARRRWMSAGSARAKDLRALAAPTPTICPACRMVADGRFGGELRVAGAFVPAHAAEIEQLIRNEAARAAEDNPLGRIIDLSWPAADRLIVTTTTEHLAKRLGQALNKALDGTVDYRFSHENKFAHVTWRRD